MNITDMTAIVEDIQYKDWVIGVYSDMAGRGYYLQVSFFADGEVQKCRKWRLSTFMTKSEIVQTAFAACLAAEEHECREKFEYKGAKIFGPHLDVDNLVNIAFTYDVRNQE